METFRTASLVLNKSIERSLEAEEIWYIKIMKISWAEKKVNEEKMEMTGYKRSLLKTTTKKKQLQFVGI